MHASFFSFLLVAVQVVGGSEESEFLGLIEIIAAQNAELETTIDQLRVEIAQLQQNYGALVASTAARNDKVSKWHQVTASKINSLAGRQRWWSTVSTKRRGLSGDTCDDPSGPQLLVEGVCSCTGGLLVQGRNVTKELDTLMPREVVTTSSGSALTSTSSARICSSTIELTGSTPSENATALDVVRGLAISPDGAFVFACSISSNGLAVVDVTTDPLHPVVVGSIVGHPNMTGAASVTVSPCGNFAYVTSVYSGSLLVVNVTNREQPVVVGEALGNWVGAWESALSSDGQFVFVSVAKTGTLIVIDVSIPTAPVAVGSVSGITNSFPVVASPDGVLAFVIGAQADTLTVVNVSDPENPWQVGSVTSATYMDYPVGVATSANGTLVYVAGKYSASIAVVDVSDPSAPTILGGIIGDTVDLASTSAMTRSPDGQYLYVVDANDAVTVVDIGTSPTTPVVVGGVTNSTHLGYPNKIVVSPNGEFVYVGARDTDAVVVLKSYFC